MGNGRYSRARMEKMQWVLMNTAAFYGFGKEMLWTASTPIGSSNSFLQNYCHLYSYCFYCFDCINNVKIEANVAKTLAKRSTWKPPATASCNRKVQESKKNELVKWTFITTKLRSMKKQKNKIFAPEKYLAGYIQRFSLSWYFCIRWLGEFIMCFG